MQLPSTFRDHEVCIIGLGYVGLTLAVAMAESGFRIHGVECDPRILGYLRQRRAHFSEIGLDAKLADQLRRGAITVSDKIAANGPATAYIITVGTPVGSDKRVRFDAIRAVAEDLARAMKPETLVALRSTVRVGTTRTFVKPILDRARVPYDLVFCPERTLEGRALAELRSLPQIVGGIDLKSTFRASQLFSFLTPSIVRVADLETAELVKLINNTQRDYMFAFANEVAAMCDATGVSALEVITAANLGYARSNIPLPGPVGGPCLEKDPYILAEGLESFGFQPDLSLSARRSNEALPSWTIANVAATWRARAGKNDRPAKLAILGLAFKGRPETDDLRGTPAIDVIACLRREFPEAELVGFDPIVASDQIATLGVRPAADVEDAFRGASIAVVQNNHEFFAKLDVERVAALMRKPGIIYDYWNQVNQMQLTSVAGVEAFGLGTTMRAVVGGNDGATKGAATIDFAASRPAARAG